MPSVSFPVAMWEDHQGGFTGRVLSGPKISATDTTPGGVLSQLKKYLVWKFRNERGTWPRVAVERLKIDEILVPIRPQHDNRQGAFVHEQVTSIPISYAWSTGSDDYVSCFVPLFDIGFHCASAGAVRKLVTEHVQRELNGKAPSTVACFLPQRSMSLDKVTVNIKSRRHEFHDIELIYLPEVAEPIGDRLTKKQFRRAWCRDELVEQVAEVIRPRHTNLLLLGESGTGKTTLLADAVRRVTRGLRQSARDEEDDTRQPRFWMTSAARMIAGMRYLGEWEERCEEVISELDEIQGVLCFEKLVDTIGVGGADPTSSLAAFLIPFLQNDELHMIAEATPQELDACRRLLPGFDSLFQVLRVEEMDAVTGNQVLGHVATQARQNLRIDTDSQATVRIDRLFRRFQPYRRCPGATVQFYERLLRTSQQQHRSTITEDDVIARFVEETGLPEFLIRDEFPLSREDVNDEIRKRIVGQDDACTAATDLIIKLKAGLNDPGRPLSVQIFCGPTGVGKTELAKTLSQYLFGSGSGSGKDRLIRLDMSEYGLYGAAERLVTQPDGSPSRLIERLREQPFSVVLLDEIEKAAHEVFDALLSVFDEGRLTDRMGRVTSFRSCVIIMTSNLGARSVSPLGFTGTVDPGAFERAVADFFRPEFFNRFDNVVTFSPLSQSEVRDIALQQLRQLEYREGLKQSQLRLDPTQRLVDHLMSIGFDARYGARPLQRVIEQHVVVAISRWMADHPEARQTTVRVDLDGTAGVVACEAL